MPYALLSVSEKRGVDVIARAALDAGYTLLSTGGTARALADAGLPVTSVSAITGFPEIMGGRVKTLHPLVHAGLLADRDDPDHLAALAEHGAPDIRLLVVNLYPFAATAARPGATRAEIIETIDIGGPAMLRAAAKNAAHVLPVVDPEDYERVARAIAPGTAPDPALAEHLARAAFAHTARYDAAIAAYFASPAPPADALPPALRPRLERAQALRYGENPHQDAALYLEAGRAPGYAIVSEAQPSYNNLVDLDAAAALVREFRRPAAAVIKHTNPAGVAARDSIADAYGAALGADPMSAFGGVLALNRPVSAPLAEVIASHFYEIVAAPGFEDAALERLRRKPRLRLVELSGALSEPALSLRSTSFGVLAQTSDPPIGDDESSWRVATRRAPTDEELDALRFAWRVAKHVKSNAIVIARDGASVGVGAGQMSRVDAVRIAVEKAGEGARGAVLASDAFFPFRDGPDAARQAGVRAIIQPGGSKRDEEVTAACDEHDVAMIHTGRRHFRH